MIIGVARLKEYIKVTQELLDLMESEELVPFGVDDGQSAILFNSKNETMTEDYLAKQLNSVERVVFITGREKESLIHQLREFEQVEISI